jgi:ribonuclease J
MNNNYKNKFLFIPLGGCNEIGMNFSLYQYNNDWIAVDCGIGFADKLKVPGVDIIVPDLSFIKKQGIVLKALIITHAHEDHIGAVAHLWHELQCPIYTTPFASHILKLKAKEKRIDKEIKIIEIDNKTSEFKIGSFKISPISITHSTLEMKGFKITTDIGSVFHTGDWKFDLNPIVGDGTDIKRLSQMKDENILALMCDSTNSNKKGHSRSEGDIYTNMLKIVKTQKQLVLVTTFASNIARIKTIAEVAKASGREIFLAGSSMDKITNAAREVGYIEEIPFLDSAEITKYDRNKCLVISTGCQGEENAALTKIARGDHRNIKIKQGDCVLFSSKIIPGNENPILATINKLIDKQIIVMTEEDHDIHASGHPYQEDLKKMYAMVNPKSIVPVHGDWLRLHEHCMFINENYGAKFRTIRIHNGAIVDITKDGAVKLNETIHSGYRAIDGNRIIDMNSKIIKERVAMSKNGLVVCFLHQDGKKKHVKIEAYGLLELNKHDMSLVKEIEEKVLKIVTSKSKDAYERIENEISKYFIQKLNKDPSVKIIL